MSEITFSIIIPIYNSEKYLYKCLDSINNQNLIDIEIILVNDGSTDSSIEICYEFYKKNPHFKIIDQKNTGLQNAWINGFRVSTGEYICFIDSDDWIELNTFDKLQKKINKYDCDFIQFGYNSVFEDVVIPSTTPNKDIVLTVSENQNEIVSSILTYSYNPNQYLYPARWGKIIKRNLIEDNLKFCFENIEMGEDINIILPSVLDAKKIVIVNDILYFYRRNIESITSKFKKNFHSNNIKLFNIVFEILNNKNFKKDINYDIFTTTLTISAIINESKTNHNLNSLERKIEEIDKSNPSKKSYSNLKLNKLNFKAKIIFILLRFNQYLVISIILKLTYFWKNLKKN